MFYTISDFCHVYEDEVRLIAGWGGMTRKIENVGILDYEMVRDVRNRYLHSNFHPDQIVLSSFLYAKDDSYLIQDAVKHLVGKGCSGLVIKNVFHLEIPESVIRYADSKDFPIFLITSQELYMEDLVYDIKKMCQNLNRAAYQQEKLSMLLSQDWEKTALRKLVKEICPSCREQYFHIYIRSVEGDSSVLLTEQLAESMQNSVIQEIIAVTGYQNGFLFTISSDDIEKIYQKKYFINVLQNFLPKSGKWAVGIGAYHLTLEEYKNSVKESFFAAAYNLENRDTYTLYADLGAYQILMPYCRNRQMQQYREKILGRILEYDIETRTQLYETLRSYLLTGCRMKETADEIGQHSNTVRYRLECIGRLTGLDYKKTQDLLQLLLAVKLLEAERMEASFL